MKLHDQLKMPFLILTSVVTFLLAIASIELLSTGHYNSGFMSMAMTAGGGWLTYWGFRQVRPKKPKPKDPEEKSG